MGVTDIDTRTEVVTFKTYKEKVLRDQMYMCPVSQRYIEVEDGDILNVCNEDYIISKDGMTLLRHKYGASYINDKIVHGVEIINGQIIRDKG